jgi:hypothetical protein
VDCSSEEAHQVFLDAVKTHNIKIVNPAGVFKKRCCLGSTVHYIHSLSMTRHTVEFLPFFVFRSSGYAPYTPKAKTFLNQALTDKHGNPGHCDYTGRFFGRAECFIDN